MLYWKKENWKKKYIYIAAIYLLCVLFCLKVTMITIINILLYLLKISGQFKKKTKKCKTIKQHLFLQSEGLENVNICCISRCSFSRLRCLLFLEFFLVEFLKCRRWKREVVHLWISESIFQTGAPNICVFCFIHGIVGNIL